MIVNSNIIPEFVRIDENIFVLMNNLKDDSPEFDSELIIKYIKMFVTKENRLISQIPLDEEFINKTLENLNEIVLENVSNIKNSKIILSRISNYLKKCQLKIKPSSQYVHVFDGKELYVKDSFLEFDYNLKAHSYYENLTIKYLKKLEYLKQLEIYNDISIDDIEYYNLFINRDLFEEFICNGLNIDNLSLLSEDIFKNKFELSDEDFSELNDNVIFSMISNLLELMLTYDEKSLDYIDAKFNFEFFVGELSATGIYKLDEFCSSFFTNFFEITGKNVDDYTKVISFVDECIEREINNKRFSSNESDLNINADDYNKLKSFIGLECELLKLISNINLDDCDSNYICKIDDMLRLEDDFILDFSNNYSILELSNFFTNGLSNILGEDFNGHIFKLINYRLMHRFEVFVSLNKSSSQSLKTYNIINRNYAVSSVKNYYEVIKKMNNGIMKDEFLKLYKDQFYMNPDLTELLVFYGNHEMIEPFDYELSCELSGVDEIEYDYDLCDLLFAEICTIMDDLFMINDKFQNVNVYNAYFQFRFLQFNYISELLDTDSLTSSLDYLENNFDKNNIYEILYTLLFFNINNYQYKIDIEISDNKTKIYILN